MHVEIGRNGQQPQLTPDHVVCQLVSTRALLSARSLRVNNLSVLFNWRRLGGRSEEEP